MEGGGAVGAAWASIDSASWGRFCCSGTGTGSTLTCGTTGACGASGASTRTWRSSSWRENSIGRKITARAISTRAPTMRCLNTLSSKAIRNFLRGMPRQPLQGLADTIKRSEQQYFVSLGGQLALGLQGLFDAGM